MKQIYKEGYEQAREEMKRHERYKRVKKRLGKSFKFKVLFIQKTFEPLSQKSEHPKRRAITSSTPHIPTVSTEIFNCQPLCEPLTGIS